jgi:hypothetical protein
MTSDLPSAAKTHVRATVIVFLPVGVSKTDTSRTSNSLPLSFHQATGPPDRVLLAGKHQALWPDAATTM